MPAALELLAETGVRLVEILADGNGDVLAIDKQPFTTDPSLAALTGSRLATIYHDHLHCR